MAPGLTFKYPYDTIFNNPYSENAVTKRVCYLKFYREILNHLGDAERDEWNVAEDGF